MKLDKGLITDLELEDMPNGSWHRALNIVTGDKPGTVSNEDGFDSVITTVPYTIIGRIETPNEVVFFSTDDGTGDSAITFYRNSTVTTIIDDSRLNFNIARPIEGVYKYNNVGELIISFWEGCADAANPTRILNIDSPYPDLTGGAFDTDADVLKLRLWVYYNPANFTMEISDDVVTGGNMASGAHYFAIQYEINNTDYTNPTPLTNPIFINSNSGKGVKLTLENLDTTYDTFRIVSLVKSEGVTEAWEVGKYDISGNSTKVISIDGNYTDTVLSLDDILVPNETYEKNGAGTYFQT